MITSLVRHIACIRYCIFAASYVVCLAPIPRGRQKRQSALGADGGAPHRLPPSLRASKRESPPPHTPSTETTLPNSDEHRRHSSATVAAQWRPNATQSQSALLACGAGRSDQGDRRRDPCTGLFARRRPRRPLNQTASSATWRQQRGTSNVAPAGPCAPAGGRTCRQRHAPRSLVSLLEALAATVVSSLRASSRQPSSRRPARKRRVCPQPRVETAGTSVIFQGRGQRQDSNLWRETS